MSKTLLLYSRICPTDSKFTTKLFEELKNLPNIEAVKIDGYKPFDIPYEQNYIKQFDNVIVLFTVNWFNLPWNFVRYMAEVWRTGDFNLEGINFYTVATTGSPLKVYSDKGFGWTAKQYLNNFSSVLKRLKANYVESFFFHNCVNEDENGENFKNYIEEVKSYFLSNVLK